MRPACVHVSWTALALLAAGCGGASGPAWRGTLKPVPLAAGEGEEVVAATGAAPGTGPEALARATFNAKRRAVEAVVARIAPDGPADPRGRAVRRRVLDAWRDFVRPGAEVVSKAEADGATLVTLRVVVTADAVAEAAASAARELARARKPRVAVVVFPDPEDAGSSGALAAERAAAEAFATRGFPLVERADDLPRGEMAKALRSGDAAGLARAARSAGAEVAVAGLAARTREREAEVYGRKVTFYTPTVSLRAIDTATGREVFSRELTGEESAGAEALSNVANDLAERCVASVLESWRAGARRLTTAVVRVEGIAFEDFARLVQLARAVSGVAAVRARPYEGEAGELEVDHACDPLDFARDLTRLEGLPLKLLGAGAESIRLRAEE